MTQHLAHKHSFVRKLLLFAIGAAASTVPLVFAQEKALQNQTQPPQVVTTSTPSFEVSSIKRNRLENPNSSLELHPSKVTAKGATTKLLIELAYHIQDFQLSGGPGWINSEKYDIEAKMEDSVAREMQKLAQLPVEPVEQEMGQVRLMLQSLLAERFKLAVHRRTEQRPVYALVVAKNGPKLTHLVEASKARGIWPSGRGKLISEGCPLEDFAEELSDELGRVVIDKTGLTGNFVFTLQWTPDEHEPSMAGTAASETADAPGSNGPSVFTAIQEQLGLKLLPQKGPIEVLVIDHIERPSQN